MEEGKEEDNEELKVWKDSERAQLPPTRPSRSFRSFGKRAFGPKLDVAAIIINASITVAFACPQAIPPRSSTTRIPKVWTSARAVEAGRRKERREEKTTTLR